MNNNESIEITNKNEKLMQDVEVQCEYEDEIKKNVDNKIKCYNEELIIKKYKMNLIKIQS